MLIFMEYENYRILKRAQLHLAPLTVLYGPSGSGKSTVLDGIHQVAGSAIHWCEICTRGEGSEDEPVALRAVLSDSPAESLGVTWHEGGRAVNARGEGMDQVVWDEHERWVKKVRGAPIRLAPSRLAETVPSFGIDVMRPDGLGLANALAKASEDDPMLLARLVNHLQEVLPGYMGPQIAHAGGNRQLAIYHDRRGKILQKDLSHGQIRLLAVTLLQYLELPPVVLLDDPELSLDESSLPFVARSLAAIVKTVGKNTRQLVVSTKSAVLVEELRAHGAKVVCTRMGEEGALLLEAPETHELAR